MAASVSSPSTSIEAPVDPLDGRPGLQSSQSLDPLPDKAKRKIVNAACIACRKRKSKCDGQRPTCAMCVHKSTACEYEVQPGETWATAMRAQNKALREEMSAMSDMFTFLRSCSEQEADKVLRHLRSGSDITTLNSKTGAFEDPDEGRGPAKKKHRSKTKRAATSRDHTYMSDASSRRDVPSPEMLDRNMEPGSSEPEKIDGLTKINPPFDFTKGLTANSSIHDLRLPNSVMARTAIESFFECAACIFHVVDKDESLALFSSAYSDGNSTLSRAQLCELFSIAAIGSHYDCTISHSLSESFYVIAKHLLDDLIQGDPLRGMKVCSLLAMYNAMDKSVMAVSYVDLGLGIARRNGLYSNKNNGWGSDEAWLDAKKTWRTLVFLDCWLSATLGYIPGLDHMISTSLLYQMEIQDDVSFADMVQTQLAKVAVLKSSILHELYPKRELDMSRIASLVDRLRAWHTNLPPSMRLSNCANESMDPGTRRVLYFLHSLYLGAIVLLQRRVISDLATEGSALSAAPQAYERALPYAQEGLMAAAQSGQIMALMLEDDLVFPRCWIIIYAAYSSAALLLYGVAQKQLHGFPESEYTHDLKQASTCLRILEICAEFDAVAERLRLPLLKHLDFLSGRGSLRETSPWQDRRMSTTDLNAARISQMRLSSTGTRLFTIPQGNSPLHDTCYQLLKIITSPFGEAPSLDGISQAAAPIARDSSPPRQATAKHSPSASRRPSHMQFGNTPSGMPPSMSKDKAPAYGSPYGAMQTQQSFTPVSMPMQSGANAPPTAWQPSFSFQETPTGQFVGSSSPFGWQGPPPTSSA